MTKLNLDTCVDFCEKLSAVMKRTAAAFSVFESKIVNDYGETEYSVRITNRHFRSFYFEPDGSISVGISEKSLSKKASDAIYETQEELIWGQFNNKDIKYIEITKTDVFLNSTEVENLERFKNKLLELAEIIKCGYIHDDKEEIIQDDDSIIADDEDSDDGDEINDSESEQAKEPPVYKTVCVNGENLGKWLVKVSETEADYDENGKVTHVKSSDGSEDWYEYDSNGKIIHEKSADGYEEWSEYDGNGKLIHRKDERGHEHWYEYDESGKQVCEKEKDMETNYEYDENGNMTHSELFFFNEKIGEIWYEYDNKGNQIHSKSSNGREQFFEYDEAGNLIYHKDSKHGEVWSEFNSAGKLIHERKSNGHEKWIEYDEKGNEVHTKDSEQGDRWYEYESSENGKKKLITEYKPM